MSSNVNELCRLCMGVGGRKHDIFNSRQSKDRQLFLKLTVCVRLQVTENDILPKKVCENCILNIEKFYNFVQQCVNAESQLKNYCTTLCIANQLKCQQKVYMGKNIEHNSNNNGVFPKKTDNFYNLPNILALQNPYNLIESNSNTDSIQNVNHIKGGHQDVSNIKVYMGKNIEHNSNGNGVFPKNTDNFYNLPNIFAMQNPSNLIESNTNTDSIQNVNHIKGGHQDVSNIKVCMGKNIEHNSNGNGVFPKNTDNFYNLPNIFAMQNPSNLIESNTNTDSIQNVNHIKGGHQDVSNIKVCMGKNIEHNSNGNGVFPKNTDNFYNLPNIFAMQNPSNLIESNTNTDSIQNVNHIKGGHQDVSNIKDVFASISDGVKFIKNNYKVPNNVNQINSSNNTSVQTITSVRSPEMNVNSLPPVTQLIVEPDLLSIQSNKTDDDQDLDIDQNKSNDKTFMNGSLNVTLTSCTACDVILESKQEMLEHSQMCKATLHKIANVIPVDLTLPSYVCDICELMLKGKENFNQHKKLHSEVQRCMLCSNSYSSKARLMRHISSHLGRKKFQCDICHKYYSQKSSLTLHRKTIHGSIGYYVCEICGKSFNKIHNFKRHMATKHDVKLNNIS